MLAAENTNGVSGDATFVPLAVNAGLQRSGRGGGSSCMPPPLVTWIRRRSRGRRDGTARWKNASGTVQRQTVREAFTVEQ